MEPQADTATEGTATEKHVLSAFTASLDRLGVAWTRCSPAVLGAALEEIIIEPAVGTPLPFEQATLEESRVALDATPEQIKAARTGVTAAVLGIADYGSVVIGHGAGAEAASLFPERHVAVLRAQDVVPDMPSALGRLQAAIRDERRSFVIATGPSATADMGALVKGAHGPREVHVVILEEKREEEKGKRSI